MNAHVSNIALSCYFELRRLASICGFLTSTAAATLVSTFLSRIDYCNSLLFGSAHDATSHLQRTQNYAARVILRLPMSSRITIHLKSLHWLPVKVRSTYKIACLWYHCHSSTAPSYVTDMLHRKPLHTRNTRSSSYTMPLLNRPAHSKATLGDRSFSFASSSVWNSIPNDVWCAPSLSSIMSRLKTYFFRSVYKDWTFSLITVQVCMVWPCYGFVVISSWKCIYVYVQSYLLLQPVFIVCLFLGFCMLCLYVLSLSYAYYSCHAFCFHGASLNYWRIVCLFQLLFCIEYSAF